MCIASHTSSHAKLFQLLPKAGRVREKRISSVLIPLAAVTRALTTVPFIYLFIFKGQFAAAVAHLRHNQKAGDSRQVWRKALWPGAFEGGRRRPYDFFFFLAAGFSGSSREEKTHLDARFPLYCLIVNQVKKKEVNQQ